MNKILRTILSLIALICMGNVFASSQYIYLTKNSSYSISNTALSIESSNSLAKCIIDPNYTLPTGCTYLDAPESQIGHNSTGSASYLYAHAVTIIGGYMYIVSQDTSDKTWIQYCKISSTDGSLSGCKNISAGNNVTPEIITSITSATIGGSNYVYIGGSYSQIFVDKVNSDGTLHSYGSSGNIFYGDGSNKKDFIRDLDVDVSNMVLHLTRGPSGSAYYIEYFPLTSATTRGSEGTYTRPSAQPYPYGVMSYNGNVYTSTYQISSGNESYAITEYAGTASPVIGQFIAPSSSSSVYLQPQGLKNYYGAGGVLLTLVAFQGGVLQTCNLFPSAGIASASCSSVSEIVYYNSNGKTSFYFDHDSPYLLDAYDIEVYNP